MARKIQAGRVLKPSNDLTLVENRDLKPISVGGITKFLAIAKQPVDIDGGGGGSLSGLVEEPIIGANSFIVKFQGDMTSLVCHVIPECDDLNPPIVIEAYFDTENNVTIFSADQIHSDTQPGPFSKIEVVFLSEGQAVKYFRSDVKNIRIGSGLITIHKLPTPFPLNGTYLSYVSEGELIEGVNIGDFVSVDANFNTEHLLCLVDGICSEKRWIKNPNGSDENIAVTDWIYGLRIISGAPRKDNAVYRMPYPGDEVNVGDEVDFELAITSTDDQVLLDLTEGMKVRLDAYDNSYHYIAQILEINQKIGKNEIIDGAEDNEYPHLIFKVSILSKSHISLTSPTTIKYYQWKIGSYLTNNITVNAVGDLTGMTLGICYNNGALFVIDEVSMKFIYDPTTKTSTANASINADVVSIEAALVIPAGTVASKEEFKNKSVAQVFCNGPWL